MDKMGGDDMEELHKPRVVCNAAQMTTKTVVSTYEF
jgi:hypothetical protein